MRNLFNCVSGLASIFGATHNMEKQEEQMNASIRDVRFERCHCCGATDPLPHGYFYRKAEGQDGGKLPVQILSVAAGKRVMEELSTSFNGIKAEVEQEIRESGLPDELEGSVELASRELGQFMRTVALVDEMLGSSAQE